MAKATRIAPSKNFEIASALFPGLPWDRNEFQDFKTESEICLAYTDAFQRARGVRKEGHGRDRFSEVGGLAVVMRYRLVHDDIYHRETDLIRRVGDVDHKLLIKGSSSRRYLDQSGPLGPGAPYAHIQHSEVNFNMKFRATAEMTMVRDLELDPTFSELTGISPGPVELSASKTWPNDYFGARSPAIFVAATNVLRLLGQQ